MKNFFKVFGVLFGAILLFIGIAFISEYGSIMWYRFFGPKKELARREVFKETRSWNEAKEQQLSKLWLEYKRSDDPAEKEALASTIRHRYADYDADKLESDNLRTFLKQVKRGDR